MASPRFTPLVAAFAFSLAAPLVAPLDAHAAPACSGQGLAFYPMSAPFKLLDTSRGWTAWWPQNYPLSSGWGLRLDGHASVIPDNAQALVARVTLSNYRGEWPECQWYDSAYYEGYLCSRDGEDSTAERYPRLRVSTAQPAPSTGAGVIRVGSGPSRPTEQLVTIPLAADGSFVLTADSVFDTRVEVIGYYAAPGSAGALYLHLLDTPAPVFNSFDYGGASDPHQLGRAMYAGESHDVPVVGTWNVGLNFGGPFSYTVPSDAQYVVGNAFAYLNWTLDSSYGVEQVSAFRPGGTVPETGLALTTWDGFGEGYEHLTGLANGAMTVHSSAPTNVVYYVSGYFSPRRDNDGNGPGLLYFPRAHALKGSGSVAADDFAGQRLYVPTYDGDSQACGVAASGRLRFIGEGEGNGQEFGILTPGTRASAAGIATGSVTNDEVTFVRRFGSSGGFEVYADTADRPGTTLRFEVDTFGVFSP